MNSVEDMYWDRVADLSKTLGLLFLGFMPHHKEKRKTRIKLYCTIHNIYWETTSISNFLHRKVCSCKGCARDRRVASFATNEDTVLSKLLPKMEGIGSVFLGWSEPFHGVTTKVSHKCKTHGTLLDNTPARNIIEGRNKTSGCPLCQAHKFKETIDTKQDQHIKEFLATGKYSENTEFVKSDRVTPSGVRSYWFVDCGKCGDTTEMFIGSIKKGIVGCSCGTGSGFSKKHAGNFYLVRWYGYGKSYLKFGITNKKVQQRVDVQNRKSKLDYEILRTWHNESGQLVWDCERDIIANMQTHACTKELMPDGYTETVEDTPENMEALLSIITKHLGE